MQTKKDIEMWEKYLDVVRGFAEQGGCWKMECDTCPLSSCNNGHNLFCYELDLASPWNSVVYVSTCTKYLKGDITFLNGKLVELTDAN